MPMARDGHVTKPEPLKPHFATIEIPPHQRTALKSEHTLAIESLKLGGDAYVVQEGNGGGIHDPRHQARRASGPRRLADRMTTWRDVERVHREHPQWSAVQIARELGCDDAYVRKTAARRGFELATKKHGCRGRYIRVPLARIEKLGVGNETPHATLNRILTAAELSEAEYRAKTAPVYRNERADKRAGERKHYLQTGALD